MRSEEDFGIGDFETMKKMVDFHHETGQNVMQLAPFGISSAFNSPYSVASSRSIDPIYINIEKLFRDLGIMDMPEAKEFFRVNDALIKQLRVNNKVDYDKVRDLKMQAFRIAWQVFLDQPRNNLHSEFKKYMRDNKDWLEDHMLYLTLKEVHMTEESLQQIHWTKGKKWDWRTWEAGLRDRDPAAMKAAKEKYNREILFKSFLQYAANKQFNELKEYGKEKGVEFMVDIPFALDGADVWMNPKLFGLEKENGYIRRGPLI